jgi:hypothetical protein
MEHGQFVPARNWRKPWFVAIIGPSSRCNGLSALLPCTMIHPTYGNKGLAGYDAIRVLRASATWEQVEGVEVRVSSITLPF